MLDELSSYAHMKPTGLKWVGAVPEHWRLERGKAFFREVNERSTTGEEELLSVSHKTGVTPRSEKNVTMFLAESNVGDKLCQPGDVVVNTMWAWMAAMGVSERRGIVSPSYGVYRAHREGLFHRGYLDRLLRIPWYRAEYLVRSTGITASRLRLYPDAFLRIPFVCPPHEEQAAIVRFLEHADRRIRRHIRAKQRLIELLDEQTRALIHQAVTRGLNPGERQRASGVAWLGNVPAHWRTHQLGRIGRFTKGRGGTKDDEVPHGVPCIRYGDLYTQHRFLIRASRSYVTVARAGAYTPIRHGDVLFAGSGETIDEIGKSASNLITEPAVCGGDVAIFRPSIDVDPAFLGYATDSPGARHQKACMGRGITVMHIYSDELKYLWIALPPTRQEQARIAEALEAGTRATRRATSSAENEIKLLREYRTRLIADVVTGKLDVRAAAANLPDNPDDHPSVDDFEDLDATPDPSEDDE